MITPHGIYDLVKQRKTWEEARDHCNQNGHHLVAFENQGEFDAVKDFIDVDRMYIGLNDRQQEGTFTWQHNDQGVGQFLPWADVDQKEGAHIHKDQDCLVVEENKKYSDVPCSDRFPFMCEYS